MKKLTQQCDRCGCSPCDCKQQDGDGRKMGFNNGEIKEILTPQESKIGKLAALILRRKQSMPKQLSHASVDEVRNFLHGRLVTG